MNITNIYIFRSRSHQSYTLGVGNNYLYYVAQGILIRKILSIMAYSYITSVIGFHKNINRYHIIDNYNHKPIVINNEL